MTKRAERRHKRDVLKKRVKRLAKDTWGRRLSDDEAAKLSDHPNECDHYWCKNPRHTHKKNDRLTMRERRQQ